MYVFYRLASRAFFSLPTIRETMGLVIGIPVIARNSNTLSQTAFLRHVSFLATLTAAAMKTRANAIKIRVRNFL